MIEFLCPNCDALFREVPPIPSNSVCGECGAMLVTVEPAEEAEDE